jgi:hypothetical protein
MTDSDRILDLELRVAELERRVYPSPRLGKRFRKPNGSEIYKVVYVTSDRLRYEVKGVTWPECWGTTVMDDTPDLIWLEDER